MIHDFARSGVAGKLFGVIRKLYSGVKLREVQIRFLVVPSTRGVMQGEALSPFLFSLYINNLDSDLLKSVCEPTKLKEISLFLLMYANDTMLMFESMKGLQGILDNLNVYCESVNIEANVTKTKAVVFRKGSKLPKSYR